jgi:hypothetical protein
MFFCFFSIARKTNISTNAAAGVENGGKLITTLRAEFRDEARAKDTHVESFMAQSYPEELEQIALLIDEGKIKL